MKGDDNEGRHEGADHDRDLTQNRARTGDGHTQCHQHKGENRRKYTRREMEKVSQACGHRACQGRFQGVPELLPAQEIFVEALPVRHCSGHRRNLRRRLNTASLGAQNEFGSIGNLSVAGGNDHYDLSLTQ